MVGTATSGGSVSSRLSGSCPSAAGSALALALLAAACGGGGSGGPSEANPAPPATTQPPASAATVTITAAGVSPRRVEIPVGGRVAFVNNDSAFHEMTSDPHPVHSDCPPMNEVGPLAPGTSRQTGAFTTARTCGYHDHGQPENAALQGEIVIR